MQKRISVGEQYIGVMSGTSMDGIDVALCKVDAYRCIPEVSGEYPYPEALKARIMKMIEGAATLQEIGEVDHVLGLEFAAAINDFIAKQGIDKKSIKAIGLHGQTIWHSPKTKYPFSMQAGDPNIVNAKCGIPVVADFRRKDMAYGGGGAPFAPAFHTFLLGKLNQKAAVVNIGGMANITILDKKLIGYDTGCGNVLMDLWTAKYQKKPYDKDGRWAREGAIDYPLLDTMLSDDYFKQNPPKSTGREKFNESWLEDKICRVDSCLRRNDNNPSSSGLTRGSKEILKQVRDDKQLQADIQRTLLEFTALSIANEVLKFRRDKVLFCGGGAKNSFLIERIRVLLPDIEISILLQGDMLEAMMMAWLAYKRMHNEPIGLKDVTGALRNAVCGGVYA